MFDGLLRQLKRLEQGIEVRIPVESDSKGYFDKECPSEECRYLFKINDEDWNNLLQNKTVYCPRCGKSSPSDKWFTSEQVERARAQSRRIVTGLIGQALREDVANFNRKFSDPRSFMRMSMHVSGSSSVPMPVPIPGGEAMQLEIVCEVCSARFAVIGCGYFCPCCGHNSVERTFDDSMRKVIAKVENLSLVRSALEETGNKDEAELICRSLLETAIQDCVMAFQRISDVLYRRIPGVPKVSINCFQRIKDGSDAWKAVFKEGYRDWLNADEMKALNLLFQKRHLLAHTEGIVDEEYLKKTGDTSYQVGQRIVIRAENVGQLVTLVTKLVNEIRSRVVKRTTSSL